MENNVVNVVPLKKIKRALMVGSKSSQFSHTHRNKELLDQINSETLQQIQDTYYQLQNLASLLNITFDANNNIVFSTDTNILPYYLVDTTPDDLVDSSGNYLYIG